MRPAFANLVVSICWVAMLAAFAVATKRARKMRQGVAEPASQRDNRSMAGLLLQALGVVIGMNFTSPVPSPEPWLLAIACGLGLLGAWIAAAGLLQLGRHLRVQAVVTEDHELITSGPYAIVRHPLYAGILLLTLSTGLVRASWPRLILALALYCAGTEIRVRVEEALLTSRFPEAARDYRRRVRAYIPFVR